MSDDSERIVSLRGGDVPQTAAPRQSVIEVCEKALERARSGDLQAVVIAGTDPDSLANYSIAGLVGSYGLVGAVCMALADLTSKEAAQ